MLQKVPVLDESGDDEYKEGSEKYVRIDPKITLSALKATNNFGGGGVSGNELRSLKWPSKYSYHDVQDGESTYSGPVAMPLKGLKRYPKNVKMIHQYEEYPRKSHRIVKHVIPTYEIQEDMDDDYDHSSPEDYSESRPHKSYLKTKTLKFIPASEVSQYIKTIPFSSLATAQSQFKPVWTPSEFINRQNKMKDHSRPSRSSRYEGTTMRVYSTDPSSSYNSPLLPIGTHLERRFEKHFL